MNMTMAIDATMEPIQEGKTLTTRPHSPLSRAGNNQAGKVLSRRLSESRDASAGRVRRRLASLIFAGNSRDVGAAWGLQGGLAAQPPLPPAVEPPLNISCAAGTKEHPSDVLATTYPSIPSSGRARGLRGQFPTAERIKDSHADNPKQPLLPEKPSANQYPTLHSHHP
ncbi:hypothetical protein [Chromobacterium violaceum]|uniref:hypothetical protein n=1 Tax=Chromobacterium violaceum TaxID=536 RepID=UPI00111C7935|nr:hypothetical protein [Chromobacterium violaceum]QRO34761.1 hypothetical protein I6K04_08565 [Chromobacterium violaceum]QRQ15434.1 hypothetical protein I6K03_14165 [Chromobacterium violaceum]